MGIEIRKCSREARRIKDSVVRIQYIHQEYSDVAVDSKMKLAIMFVLLGCAFLAIAEQTSTVSDNDSLAWSASGMWQNIQDAVLSGVETLREKLSQSGIVDDVEAKVLTAQEKVKEEVKNAQKKVAESVETAQKEVTNVKAKVN